MLYNPFDKPIGAQLTADDLEVLVTKEVKEGYYVEYKSAKPDNKKIGHSIASFGNTFGGWYVIGVDADKTQNVAKRVCGFTAADWPDPNATVRDVVKTHISPPPVFFPQVIRLDNVGSRLALVVYVPGEQDTPFVTAEGRIYARVQDSSDPVPAQNRYDLERLEARGRESKHVFAQFCRDTRNFSNADADLGWLHVFMTPYPRGLVDRFELTTEKGLAQALDSSRTPHAAKAGDQELFSGNLPFNAGQVTTSSVILRQVAPARSGRLSLMVELFQGGSAKLHIPLWQIANPILWSRGSGYPEPLDAFESPEVAGALRAPRAEADADPEESLHLVRFFDLGQLWLTLVNLLNYYEAWLGDDAERVELKVGLSLGQVWRHSPFLDAAVWAEHVRKYGLPIIHESSVRDPWPVDEAFLLEARGSRQQLWLDFGPHVTQLVGLPAEVFSAAIGTTLERVSRLQQGNGIDPSQEPKQ
jgi:Putative DNA-binding domain